MKKRKQFIGKHTDEDQGLTFNNQKLFWTFWVHPPAQLTNCSTNSQTNLSINQPTFQSANQPLNEPTNLSMNQPTSQSPNQPFNQPTNLSINQPTS